MGTISQGFTTNYEKFKSPNFPNEKKPLALISNMNEDEIKYAKVIITQNVFKESEILNDVHKYLLYFNLPFQ